MMNNLGMDGKENNPGGGMQGGKGGQQAGGGMQGGKGGQNVDYTQTTAPPAPPVQPTPPMQTNPNKPAGGGLGGNPYTQSQSTIQQQPTATMPPPTPEPEPELIDDWRAGHMGKTQSEMTPEAWLRSQSMLDMMV